MKKIIKKKVWVILWKDTNKLFHWPDSAAFHTRDSAIRCMEKEVSHDYCVVKPALLTYTITTPKKKRK